MTPSKACALVLLAWMAGAVAAPLTPEQQQLFRDVHADRLKSSSAMHQKSVEATRLARQQGREGNIETALFLLELGSGRLLYYFADDFKAPATPELEAAVLKHLRNPELETCTAAWVIKKYQSRALYEALLAESRKKDRGYERCVYAIVNTDLPGIEADLTALLPGLTGYYECAAVASLLVRRGYQPAEAALLGWLDRTEPRNVGGVAWIVVKLQSPGMANGLLRRLDAMKGLPPGEETERNIESLISAVRHATPGTPLERTLLPQADLAAFPPASREKIAALLRHREEEVRRAAEVTPDNFVYWIGLGQNDRVRDFMRRGADANAQGRTADDRPLIRAALSNNLEALRLLLDAGADPNVRDARGDPLLRSLATRKAHVESLEGPQLAAAKLLLQRGANPSAAGADTRTPLHVAAGLNFRQMAVLLVEGGADLNAEATDLRIHGLTPLLVAEDLRYDELAAYLRAKGGKVNPAFVAKRAAQRTVNNLAAPFIRGH